MPAHNVDHMYLPQADTGEERVLEAPKEATCELGLGPGLWLLRSGLRVLVQDMGAVENSLDRDATWLSSEHI